MTRTRYSPSLGRHIEVETLDTGVKPSRRRRREPDLFVKVPLRLMMAAGMAIRDRNALLVLILLLHLSFRARSQSFPCPNGFLQRFGISRWAKRRALAKLEAAGFIATRRDGQKALNVILFEP
jgi:hypothetical protein